LDAPVFDADLQGRLGGRRRAVPDRAVTQRETRAVAGADDLVALHRAFAQRAAAVRATVVDGEDALALAEQEDRRVIDHNSQWAALGHQRGVRRRRPLGRAGI